MAKKLPPDPDRRNGDRARWAGEALKAFMGATRTDAEEALGDLLADLGHYCDRRGIDFETEFRRGRGMYYEETNGKGQSLLLPAIREAQAAYDDVDDRDRTLSRLLSVLRSDPEERARL